MKYMILILALIFSNHAFAVSDCGGHASDGAFVTVHIETTGAKGIPSSGEVQIEKSGNKYGYRFGQTDIAQYFEFDDQTNSSTTVGLNAFANGDAPVSMRYVGGNYADMDLKAVIADHQTQDLKGNWLRVWTGPGRSSADQYQLTEIACSVYGGI